MERWTSLPAGQLLDAIRHYDPIGVGDAVYRISRPTTWDTIDHAVGTSLNQSWATLTELRTWRRDLTRTARAAQLTTPTNP